MNRDDAIIYLIQLGWNFNGASAIVDALIDDGLFEDISFEELKRVSEDYADR